MEHAEGGAAAGEDACGTSPKMTMDHAEGRVLGIDLGSKTIGLAVSDETRTIARPLRTLARQEQGYRRNVAELRRVVEELGVGLIVVGLPLTMDGGWGRQARSAEAFAELIRTRLHLPVALQDERLTTFVAEEALKEGGLDRAERKRHVDAVAASLILRAYLDRCGDACATNAGGDACATNAGGDACGTKDDAP